MLQAPSNVNKTVVIVMTLAGSGAMLYYGYTKLKSKKRSGPRTTARKPVRIVPHSLRVPALQICLDVLPESQPYYVHKCMLAIRKWEYISDSGILERGI